MFLIPAFLFCLSTCRVWASAQIEERNYHVSTGVHLHVNIYSETIAALGECRAICVTTCVHVENTKAALGECRAMCVSTCVHNNLKTSTTEPKIHNATTGNPSHEHHVCIYTRTFVKKKT